MINLYQFDQPLDLRLKALNLSLSPNQKNYSPAISTSNIIDCRNSANSSCGNISLISNNNGKLPSFSYCSNSSLTNSSSNTSSQVNIAPSAPAPISNPIVFAMIPSHECLKNSMKHTSINIQQNQHQRQQHHNHKPHRLSPLISHHYTSPQGINGSSGGSHSHSHSPTSRSTNVHRQPLNHHQPHPSSRLHPPLLPPPSSTLIESPDASLHNRMQAMTQNLVTQQHILTNPQPLYEHIKQQSPPQYQQLHPQHLSPKHPVRSLSLSCHTMTNYSPTSSSTPNSNTTPRIQQRPTNADGNCSTKSPDKLMEPQQSMAPNHIGHQQLIRLDAMMSNPAPANGFGSFVARNRVSPTSPNCYSHSQTLTGFSSNTTTPTTQVSKDNKINQTSAKTVTSNTTVSPTITRQHSLVSKYHCKPCGIVFSQPETLRAHQESYCTKRDRARSQIRSQSAVSAAAVQQEKCDSASKK